MSEPTPNTSTQPAPSSEAVARALADYLACLFPPGSKGYLAVCTSDPASSRGMLSKHIPVGELAKASAYVTERDAEGLNTYVGLCAHGSDPGPYKRGVRADKVSGAVFWVDIDRKGPGHAANDLPETLQDLTELLAAVEFEPSFIVDTGGGWHAYWRLNAPVDLADAKTRADFQKVEQALQKKIGAAAKERGWHLDNTSDLARVLRPPGTHNHKPGREVKPLVSFVLHPSQGQTYDYRILSRAFSVQESNLAKLFTGAQAVPAGVAASDTDADVAPAAAITVSQQPIADGIEWDAERTVETIKDKVKRNKKPERATTLQAFIEGQPWAEKGERDATAQRLASWLCFFTGGLGNVEAIIEMALPSLAAMEAQSPDDFISEEKFADKVQRAMVDARRVCDEQRAVEQRIRERGFKTARGQFEARARHALSSPASGTKLPLGAPQDAGAPSGVTQLPAGRAPAGSAPRGAAAGPIESTSALTSTDAKASGKLPSSSVLSLFGASGLASGVAEPYSSSTPPIDTGAQSEDEPRQGSDADRTTSSPVLSAASDEASQPGVAGNLQAVTALALVPPPSGDVSETEDRESLTYYTRTELEAAADDQSNLSGVEVSIHDLRQRMIMQKGETFYLLRQDGDGVWRYGEPLQRGELDNALAEDFKCVPEMVPQAEDPTKAEPFFSWHAMKADGELRRKTVKEVLADLGTVARGDVIYDLRIPRSYFEPRSRAFYVAACPVRPELRPEYHQLVDAWLRTFGEDERDREKFLDFCATLTDLRHPTCGVFLSGPPSTGKTMFAEGAARLWTTGKATAMKDALGNFNADLARCPLLVADEALPLGPNGRPVSTADLRELIGSDRRPLRRKFMANATIVGAIRCLFLANNEDMLHQGDENLGADALEAVAGRFLHIRTKDGAAFLKSLGGRGGTKGWVDEDVIARHLLWLRDNRRVTYGNRFIVDGHESKVSQLLATSGTIPGLVSEWLARCLNKPHQGMLQSGSLVLGGGKFWVNGQALLDNWSIFIKSDRAAPTLAKINKALGNLSFDHTTEREYFRGKRTRYWKIKPDTILRWADENQIGDDPEAMRERINGPEIQIEGNPTAVFNKKGA